MAVLVLGSGIVGSAAVWDLVRRGHEVTVADADGSAAAATASRFGATGVQIDANDSEPLSLLLADHDAVVSAIPYYFGTRVASAAISAGCHYLDFGGNPTVVVEQKAMDGAARSANLMIVPDCGLAPGLADVMAEDLISTAPDGPIDSIQLRVGALPQIPTGALGYQIAFSPAGLINEYAEPCEVIEDGVYATVEPLTRFEDVDWDTWGPLEAFSTAGGTSTLAEHHVGRVQELEYKTLRFPGHGIVFRSLLEMGMFDEEPSSIGSVEVAPRQVLLNSLDKTLPRGAPDVVLVRVWSDVAGVRTTLEIVDTEKDGISALARTTAFPATALADLILRGEVDRPGVITMNEAVLGSELLPELADVGIDVRRF